MSYKVKKENQKKAQKIIFVEHVIRLIKIYKVYFINSSQTRYLENENIDGTCLKYFFYIEERLMR